MTIGKTDHLHHMFIWFKPWPRSLVVVSNKTIKVCKYFYYIKMNLLHIFEYITRQVACRLSSTAPNMRN